VRLAAELSAADLRELTAAADLRELRRKHSFEALLNGPPLSGLTPLGPLSPEILTSAMSCLAHWSVAGLVKAADQYAAGRLAPEVVDNVVTDLVARSDRGEL
jgi:hypothetical protein